METLRVILTHFSEEILGILLALLVALLTLLMAFWVYHRRRSQKLTHQIPASVVKNYLDSIITNSKALKSSLFLEGSGESVFGDPLSSQAHREAIPSVVSTGQLPEGNVRPAPASSQEEMAEKEAEIASLRLQVGEKNKMVDELEKVVATSGQKGGHDLERENVALKDEVEKLKSELSQSAPTPDQDLLKERNQLKDRLAEYQVIEEDLANLKRFQEENKELKQTIEQLKSPSLDSDSTKIEEFKSPEGEHPEGGREGEGAQLAQGEQTQEEESISHIKMDDNRKKSAEELLSEFEKMLG